jgi:hypothetical protein
MTKRTKADNRQTQARALNIAMMETPDHWPQWPLLPIKRYVPDERRGSKQLQVGFLVASAENRWTVYLDNMIAATARAKKRVEGSLVTAKDLVEGVDKLDYASATAIVDDGWEVD